MTILISNIKELLQIRDNGVKFVSGKDMKELPTLKDAYVLIEDDTIVDFGLMSDCHGIEADEHIDATGKLVDVVQPAT